MNQPNHPTLILILSLSASALGGCAATIGGLVEADDDSGDAATADVPDADLDTGLEATDAAPVPTDTNPVAPIDAIGPDTDRPDTSAASDAPDIWPSDTTAPDVGSTDGDPPGVVRCGPTATACDRRGTGNECCLIEGVRRCVGPDDPVPGDVCPAPAICDDGGDCRRFGDPVHVHCCVADNGGAQCRSACAPTETEAL